MNSRDGQATLEVLLSAGLVTLLLAGSGWILKASWERGKCAWIVFETTHGALQANTPAFQTQVLLNEDRNQVVGARLCGSTLERAGFRKLEELTTWK